MNKNETYEKCQRFEYEGHYGLVVVDLIHVGFWDGDLMLILILQLLFVLMLMR